MRKLSLLLMIGTILAPWSAEAACKTAPDCARLGFTTDASKCSGTALKCPWDATKAACKEKPLTSELPILYGDGTVSKEILSGKTPIGVVFDETNKLAIALTNVKKDGTAGSEVMLWSSSYCDTPGLQNCTTTEIPTGTNLTPITCGVDGRLNTNAILASTCNGTTYAATATNNYQPAGCTKDFCKKSKWFLPSIRDLQNIYLQKTQIDASLTLLKSNGATDIGTKHYWSSTEGNTGNAWRFIMRNGIKDGHGKVSNHSYVRPVIYYDVSKTQCKVINCTTCVSGNSAQCSICASGYILQDGLCVSASLPTEPIDGCPLNTTPQICNGQEYCCPAGVSCLSSSGSIRCYMKNPDVGGGLL